MTFLSILKKINFAMNKKQRKYGNKMGRNEKNNSIKQKEEEEEKK